MNLNKVIQVSVINEEVKLETKRLVENVYMLKLPKNLAKRWPHLCTNDITFSACIYTHNQLP